MRFTAALAKFTLLSVLINRLMRADTQVYGAAIAAAL
jgi:hypothetical protein